MFNSSINFNNEAEPFFKALLDNLIDPSYELDQAAKRIRSDIQDHFNKTKNPARGRWKPSKRVLKNGGKTLTKSGALRRGLRSRIKPTFPKFKIEIYPTGDSVKYAKIHNNGGQFKNRSGNFTTMPKRQYAWVSREAKKEIEQLFLFGI